MHTSPFYLLIRVLAQFLCSNNRKRFCWCLRITIDVISFDSMTSTLLALRAGAEAGAAEQKRLVDRKRNVLVLVHHYLTENGYLESAERVQHEAGMVINKFEVADNVDLNLIVGEYEAYYEMRFDKKPKLIRKGREIEEPAKMAGKGQKQENSKKAGAKDKKLDSSSQIIQGSSSKFPSVSGATPPPVPEDDSNPLGMGVQGTQVGHNEKKKSDSAQSDRIEERYRLPNLFC